MTGFDAATTSENAADTSTRAWFSVPMDNPNVIAIGRIPKQNSFMVGTGIGFPVDCCLISSTTKAAEEEMNKCNEVTNFG